MEILRISLMTEFGIGFAAMEGADSIGLFLRQNWNRVCSFGFFTFFSPHCLTIEM